MAQNITDFWNRFNLLKCNFFLRISSVRQVRVQTRGRKTGNGMAEKCSTKGLGDQSVPENTCRRWTTGFAEHKAQPWQNVEFGRNRAEAETGQQNPRLLLFF